MLTTGVRLFVLLVFLCSAASPQTTDNDKIWKDFLSWMTAQPATAAGLNDYRTALIKEGLSPEQADERVALIPKLYNANPAYREQAAAVHFNRLYRSPGQTRFTTEPNAFLAATIRDLKPGRALDVAMGQGRNALYVASKGWDVTGFDIAEEGMKVAAENALKAGTRITTVKSTFDGFDYGRDRWDLIYFVYTDAPVVDPKYVARICEALKPGGLLLIDRPFRSLTNPEPGWPDNDQDKPNALLKAWSGLHILHYEDTTGYGDWQQTAVNRLEYKLRIVRLLATKRQP